MRNLYIDFDGVILDTISVSYKMLEKRNLMSVNEIDDFYKNLNWHELIENTPIFRDSINCIKKLVASKKFDVKILTHVIAKGEDKEKKEFIKKQGLNIEVIACPKKVEKCDYVNAKGAILIDDYIGNLDLWHQKGGIAIKFSDKGKKGKYLTITKLDQILEIDFDKLDGERF